jgi:integrase
MAHLGESAKLVAERLGHSDTRMTLEYYTHTYDGQQEAANKKLENLLYGEG